MDHGIFGSQTENPCFLLNVFNDFGGPPAADVCCFFVFFELAWSDGDVKFGLWYGSDVTGCVVILNGLIGVWMDGFASCLLVMGGFAFEGLIGVRMDGFAACLLVTGGSASETVCCLLGVLFVLLTPVVPLRGERGGVVIGISHKNVISRTLSKPWTTSLIFGLAFVDCTKHWAAMDANLNAAFSGYFPSNWGSMIWWILLSSRMKGFTQSISFRSDLGRFLSCAFLPVRISNMTTPKDQTSLFDVRWPVCMYSGAAYPIVPFTCITSPLSNLHYYHHYQHLKFLLESWTHSHM